MPSRSRLLTAAVVVPLLTLVSPPMVSSGQSLHEKIEGKQRQVEARKDRERVLTSDIARYSDRINRLQDEITTLQRRQVSLQADVEAKQAELARIQESLRRERLRLMRLRARLAEERIALARRLVEQYKADAPDIVTVVLNADGFEQLLERAEFLSRMAKQDARVIGRVRLARTRASEAADRLEALEAKARDVAAAVEAQRDRVVEVKTHLVDRRVRWVDARGEKSAALASTRASRRELEGHLVALEKEQARVAARLASQTASRVAGPVRQGSGALSWPASGPLTSPFGPRWGRLHAGIDISLPEGTPLRAAASGRVAIAGWTGGYGNYTCIQHAGALSSCYAHQQRLGTSVGAFVTQGQVMGYAGNTGNSFGSHLHFETRVNGRPVDPMTYL